MRKNLLTNNACAARFEGQSTNSTPAFGTSLLFVAPCPRRQLAPGGYQLWSRRVASRSLCDASRIPQLAHPTLHLTLYADSHCMCSSPTEVSKHGESENSILFFKAGLWGSRGEVKIQLIGGSERYARTGIAGKKETNMAPVRRPLRYTKLGILCVCSCAMTHTLSTGQILSDSGAGCGRCSPAASLLISGSLEYFYAGSFHRKKTPVHFKVHVAI